MFCKKETSNAPLAASNEWSADCMETNWPLANEKKKTVLLLSIHNYSLHRQPGKFSAITFDLSSRNLKIPHIFYPANPAFIVAEAPPEKIGKQRSIMEESKAFAIVPTSEDVVMRRNPQFEVTWEDGDPENPRNWSVWYRSFIVAAMSFSTTIV